MHIFSEDIGTKSRIKKYGVLIVEIGKVIRTDDIKTARWARHENTLMRIRLLRLYIFRDIENL